MKSFLLLYANMVYGWFLSKVYLATTIGLSILLKSFLSKHFLLWAEPRNDVDVGTPRRVDTVYTVVKTKLLVVIRKKYHLIVHWGLFKG